MKATLAQIAPRLGRLDDNLTLHHDVLRAAADSDTDLVIFPELSLTGYLLRDHVPQVATAADELPELLAGAVSRSQPLDAVVGFVELTPGSRCYSSAAYLRYEPGEPIPRLVAVHRKVHLPTYGMFDERRYFSAGRQLRAFDSPILGRCGMLLCEDLWHPSSAYVMCLDGPGLEGARALIGLANSPARGIGQLDAFTVANLDTWQRINALYARIFGVLMFHVQRVGVEDSYIFTGGSEVVLPSGEVAARAPLFEESLLEVEIDLDADLHWHRASSPSTLAEDIEIVRRELKRISKEAY